MEDMIYTKDVKGKRFLINYGVACKEDLDIIFYVLSRKFCLHKCPSCEIPHTINFRARNKVDCICSDYITFID
jgi:hypothetical protein